MQNKLITVVVVVIVLLLCYLIIPSNSSAILNSIIRKAIVVAYMNGYVDALALKIKDIENLKANESLLRQKVENEATDYILTVEKMNQKQFK
jgi:hypothetical protein